MNQRSPKPIPFIDAWQPAGLATGPRDIYHHRFVVSILLSTLFYLLVVISLNYSFLNLQPAGSRLVLQFGVWMTLGIVASLAIIRKTGQRNLALQLFLSSMLLGFMYVTLHTGGINSPAIVCTLILPPLATLSISVWAGVAWSVLLATMTIPYVLADRAGLLPQNVMNADNRQLAIYLSLITSNLFLTVIAIYYELLSKRLRNQVEKEHDMYLHLANHDSLTELANRRHFITAIEAAIAEAKSQNGAFCILYFDLNYFKSANDQHGHHFGDQILSQFSQRLQEHTRQYDLVARLGGDEFSILLKEMNDEKVIAKKLTDFSHILAQAMDIDGISYQPSASIGYAIYPKHGHDYESLLKAADQSMYRVKRQQPAQNNTR